MEQEHVLEQRGKFAVRLDAGPVVRLRIAPAPSGDGVRVTLTGHVDATVEILLLNAERGVRKREALRKAISRHNAIVAAQAAPSTRGVSFAPVPPPGYRATGQSLLLPLEREAVLETVTLDSRAQQVTLPGFQVIESDNAFEIYLDESKRVRVRAADAGQLALDAVATSISADDLVRWLDRGVQQPDIVQPHLRAYLKAVVNHLLND